MKKISIKYLRSILEEISYDDQFGTNDLDKIIEFLINFDLINKDKIAIPEQPKLPTFTKKA